MEKTVNIPVKWLDRLKSHYIPNCKSAVEYSLETYSEDSRQNLETAMSALWGYLDSLNLLTEQK